MKSVYINELNEKLNINNNIFNILINDPLIYRKLVFNINESIIYYKDNNIIELNDALIIYNPLELDFNDKKTLNLLYKTISKNYKEELLKTMSSIERIGYSLFDSISVDYPITIDDEIETNKLFSLFGLKLKTVENQSYLELLINYFKIHSELNNSKLIITFGLLEILTNEEQIFLEKELEYIGIDLINISISKTLNNVESIILDKDWCII